MKTLMVEITRKAHDGIMACRESGEVNMFWFHGVQEWCNKHEYYHAVTWLQENQKVYSIGISNGFLVEEAF